MTKETVEDYFTELYYYGEYTVDQIKEISEGIMETVFDIISKCQECGKTDCKWLQRNEGNCCNDDDNIEQFKGCPPCNDEKARDMTDTAVDMEKEKMLDENSI